MRTKIRGLYLPKGVQLGDLVHLSKYSDRDPGDPLVIGELDGIMVRKILKSEALFYQ